MTIEPGQGVTVYRFGAPVGRVTVRSASWSSDDPDTSEVVLVGDPTRTTWFHVDPSGGIFGRFASSDPVVGDDDHLRVAGGPVTVSWTCDNPDPALVQMLTGRPAVDEPDRFDHRDLEVEALMERRAHEQAARVVEARTYGVVDGDVAEMRRRHRETDDPLDVDEPTWGGPSCWSTTPPSAWTTSTPWSTQQMEAYVQEAQAIGAGEDEALSALEVGVRLYQQGFEPDPFRSALAVLRIDASLRKIGTVVGDFAQAVTDAAPAFDARSDERRHRTSASCPRHGPTRGGTCWKCRR